MKTKSVAGILLSIEDLQRVLTMRAKKDDFISVYDLLSIVMPTKDVKDVLHE